MLLRTLVVDDEHVARRVLREELESIAGVEIIGEAESGGAALDEIAGLHPDLVLLDQMPSMSGLDVVSALRAFDAGAIDYQGVTRPNAGQRIRSLPCQNDGS